MDTDLRVALENDQWQLRSERTSDVVTLVNDYLGYLADRNYSPQTVRTYAFALLAFCRWLSCEDIDLDAVTTEVLLDYLRACRQARIAGRPGPERAAHGRPASRRLQAFDDQPATGGHRRAVRVQVHAEPRRQEPGPQGQRGAEAECRGASRDAQLTWLGALAIARRFDCESRVRCRGRSTATKWWRSWKASGASGTVPSPGSWCSAGYAPEKCSPSRSKTSTSADAGSRSLARAERSGASLSTSTWRG